MRIFRPPFPGRFVNTVNTAVDSHARATRVMRAVALGTVLLCTTSTTSLAGATTPGTGSTLFAPIIIASGPPNGEPTAITFDGSHVWVANSGNEIVQVDPIDGSSATALTGPLTALDNPVAVVGAQSKLWVANKKSNSVTEFNSANGSVITTVSGSASGINTPVALASSGKIIFVANYGSNTVTEIDQLSGTVIGVLGSGTTDFAGPDAMCVVGQWLFVVNALSNSITQINAVTGVITGVFNHTALNLKTPVAIASDGKNLWVANSATNSLTEFVNGAAGTSVQPVALPKSMGFSGPSSLTVASGVVWVTNRLNNSVVGLSVVTANVVAILSAKAYGFAAPAASASSGSSLWITNSSNHTVTELSLAAANAKIPSAPSSVSVSTAGKIASVNWSAPTSNGGSGITHYLIVSSTKQQCVVKASALSAFVDECVFSGLALNPAIRFTVSAFNAVGQGKGLLSAPVQIATEPTAPTNVKVKVIHDGATISWSPATPNGSAVTSYVATGSDGSQCASSTSVTHCQVINLALGVKITYRVVAHNSVGPSAASAASAAVEVLEVPSAPLDVQVTISPVSATVTWLASSSNGGSPITSYVASAFGAGLAKTCVVIKTTGTASTNQCTISGLTNGTAYTFSVVAKNHVGTSAAATVSQSLTPATTPSAPQSATAVASNDQITVSWSAPKSTGGSPVTKYVASDGTSQCTVVPSSPGVTPPTALTCNLLGAMPGGTYAISVWAYNDIGRSPAVSLTSVFVTTPSAPQGVVASTANSQTTITWETPLSNGGGAILSYVVTDFNGHSCTVASTARSCTITGLTNGLVYNFAIDATNIQGQGNFANVIVVPSTAPTSPLGVTAVAGDTRVTVSWTDEQFPDNGGAPIATYVVTAVSNAALTCTLVYTYGATTQCTVLGLTNGVSYSFIVVASNAAGHSPASAPSNSVVPFSSIPVG